MRSDTKVRVPAMLVCAACDWAFPSGSLRCGNCGAVNPEAPPQTIPLDDPGIPAAPHRVSMSRGPGTTDE